MAGVTLWGAAVHMGEKFGDYELITKIATGGMAEIYLARLSTVEGFSRTVVVKRMLPQLAIRDDFVTMFLDEARLAANLAHPNIVQVFNLGETGGSYYMAMELIDGPHLGALFAHSLRKRVPLPIELCVFAAARAADGLHYAHELTDAATGKRINIVHRDISPQNILVSRHGDVKVTDFGVAKAETQEAKTRTGVIKGKVSYMSPEQCLGDHVDCRTDVFALGIVLYELLTRRRLFRDKSDLLVMQRITAEEVKPPSHLNPALDSEIDEICLKALARDRDDRFLSAGDFSEALDIWLALNNHPDGRGKLSRWLSEHAPDLGLSQLDTADANSQPSWTGPKTPSQGERKEETVSTPALPAADEHGATADLSATERVTRSPSPTVTASLDQFPVDDKTNPDDSPLDDDDDEPASETQTAPGSLDTLSEPTGEPVLDRPRLPMAAMVGGAAAVLLAVGVGVAIFAGGAEPVPVPLVMQSDTDAGNGKVRSKPAARSQDAGAPTQDNAKKVRLKIVTVPPGAEVEVAGKKSKSPVEQDVAPGQQRIKVRFANGTITRKVKVTEATELKIVGPIALIIKTTPPGAAIKVTGGGLPSPLSSKSPTTDGKVVVEPGKAYSVQASKAGFVSKRVEVTPKEGGPHEMSIVLKAQKVKPRPSNQRPVKTAKPAKTAKVEYAQLGVLSRPYVEVKVVGGAALGPTPVQPKRVKLKGGRVRLRVTNPNGIKETVSVSMHAGETKRVILQFEEQGGKWKLASKKYR